MKFRNLHMSGFLSYEDQDIDMSNLAYTAIVGANGAGKSTIPPRYRLGAFWHVSSQWRFGLSH